jgi:hypothetical protein
LGSPVGLLLTQRRIYQIVPAAEEKVRYLSTATRRYCFQLPNAQALAYIDDGVYAIICLVETRSQRSLVMMLDLVQYVKANFFLVRFKPACEAYYNVFQTVDPGGCRIEPCVDRRFAKVRMPFLGVGFCIYGRGMLPRFLASPFDDAADGRPGFFF